MRLKFARLFFGLHHILRIDRQHFGAYIHITSNEIPAGWFIVLNAKCKEGERLNPRSRS